MLITRAEIDGAGPFDVRLAGDKIGEIARHLDPGRSEEVFEADGGALLPGLHDHHLHAFALAASSASVRCGPPDVRDRLALSRALAAADAAMPEAARWLRGFAYHESVAGPIDRALLDALVPRRPVRIQHRSGGLWALNSAAVDRLELDAGVHAPGVERDARGRATGRLFRLDGWLRERIGAEPPPLEAVGRWLARFGVTGFTDATPTNGAAELRAFEAAARQGALPQRVRVMGGPDLPVSRFGRVSRGERKWLLEDHAPPAFETLCHDIDAAHAQGRAVAIHAVTRAALVLAAAALAEAGARPGDRIEHASVAPPEAVALLAALPVTVVTQPNFLRERGDAYREDVEPADRRWLYRARGWIEAGVPLGAGTDAPFGDPDPWLAMQAAVDRRSDSGACLAADESLSPERALALFTTPADAPGGSPRRVEPGARADLCLLDRPWRRAREALASASVRATWIDGRPVFRLDAGADGGFARAVSAPE